MWGTWEFGSLRQGPGVEDLAWSMLTPALDNVDSEGIDPRDQISHGDARVAPVWVYACMYKGEESTLCSDEMYHY